MSLAERVLVTGGTGYIGTHLIRSLTTDGVDTVALLRPSSNQDRLRSMAPQADIAIHDGGSAALGALVKEVRPDVTIHAAGHYVSNHAPGDVDHLVRSNILFGAQLLEALHTSGCTRVVTVGSYFEHSPGAAAMSLYAATKRAFDEILTFYGSHSGIRFATCVLHDVYGPGDWRPKLVPRLLEAATAQDPIKLGARDAGLNLVHVDDVVSALLLCAQGLLAEDPKVIDTRFSVRQDEATTLADLVATIEAASDRSIDARWNEYGQPRRVIADWNGPRVPGWQPAVSLDAGIADALTATATA